MKHGNLAAFGATLIALVVLGTGSALAQDGDRGTPVPGAPAAASETFTRPI
jgi:hypothetical protein